MSLLVAVGACSAAPAQPMAASFGGGLSHGETEGGDTDTDEEGPVDGAAQTSTTGATAIRCNKIDFLFVLETQLVEPECVVPGDGCDESAFFHRERIRNGFKTLVSELNVRVGVDDLRFMVTGSAVPEHYCSADYANHCGTADPEPPPPTCELDVEPCDEILGAGRNGVGISREVWEYACPGQSTMLSDAFAFEQCMDGRWVDSGSQDLQWSFDCPLHWEQTTKAEDRMMDALSSALGPLAASGQCNEGFVRDDALLVVVLVERGDDAPDLSSGTPETWMEAVVAAKQDIAENVVVLALGPDGDLDDALCPAETATPFAADLRDFARGFAHGKWDSSCLPDYTAFFRQGAQIIDMACDDYQIIP